MMAWLKHSPLRMQPVVVSQWHPEWKPEKSLISRKIFEAFGSSCLEYSKNMEDKDIRNWLIENSIQEIETMFQIWQVRPG